MESSNTFQEGMNSDISKVYQKNNSYLKAINFRPVGDVGGSVGSLVNIRGNECAITFPIVRGVYKLQFVPHDTGNQTGVINITVNGQTTANITIDSGTKVTQLTPYLTALINCSNNLTAINPTFSVANDTESLIIYQNNSYSTCDITESSEPIVSINIVSGTPELYYVNSSETQVFNNTAYVPTLNYQNLTVIGSTSINEDIYLFTCPETNSNQTGQVWSLIYNESTKVNTLTLIYNGFLNFSINYPIAPSAAIGRYELANIQRIYWTDFNNPVRGMNVTDPNVMALTSALINLTPSSLLSVPILSNLLDGAAINSINTDTNYQCAYRLVKANGGMTNYSVCSNIVYPTTAATNTYNFVTNNFAAIRGVASTINKALEFTVEGIDTSYDTIEFVIVERKNPNIDTFNVYKYETQIIAGQETIKSIFRNPSDKEEITLQEFLLEGASFTHCKTLESKDNRLFFGNVREGLSDYLDTYDSRVYRFGNSATTASFLKYENDTAVTTLIAPNYTSVDETWDVIPCYNLGFDTTENALWQNNKYQLNSTIVGGTGPNISYKFGSKLFRADINNFKPTTNAPGAFDAGTNEDSIYGSGVNPNKQGFRVPGTLNPNNATPTIGMNPYENGAPYQTYPSNNVSSSSAFEYFNGTFKSYQHNEIYPFAIVFYTKSGKSSFVKWIGDIKFPDYSDSPASGLEGRTNSNTTCPDFRSCFVDTTDNSTYNVLPYIEFEVNIPPALAGLISGYEIVRTQRTRSDMYIKAHGMLHYNTVSEVIGDYSVSSIPTTNNQGMYNNFGPAQNVFLLSFDAYNHIIDGYNNIGINVNNNVDKIRFTERYSPIHTAGVNTHTSAISFDEYHTITKYYSFQQFYGSNLSYDIQKANYIPTGGNDGVFYNYWIDGTWSALGSPTSVIYTAGVATAGTAGINNNFDRVLGIHYDPSKLSTQYGGRRYLNRGNREYISTGSFYPIGINDSGIKTLKVFGGDMFHSLVDIHKNIRNWGQSSISATTNKKSLVVYFPTQSVYNIDLRNGNHANRNLNVNNTLADLDEGFDYLFSYSYENNIRKFYPEPVGFNLVSEWNNRIFWSNVKINGETSDSWTSIPVLNYYDVEGAYGPINAFSILNNNFYFLQDRALGFLYINPITTITGSNGLPVTLGKGSTVEKHEYTSIDAGTKHQWSVYRSSSAITFVDSRSKKIYLFNGQSLIPISDVKGAKGFTNKVLHDSILTYDNPIIGAGILVTYDYLNNEFLYTFRNQYIDNARGEESVQNDDYTLVYSDLTGSFSSFYSFTPYIYINNRNKLFSLKDHSTTTNKIYMHNVGDYCTFYGVVYPSQVSSVINPNPKNTKIFDNLSWMSESIKEDIIYKDNINDYPSIEFTGDSDDIPYLTDTIRSVRFYNDYQNTDWITLAQTNPITNLRRSEQGWNIQVPRNKVNYDSFPINTYSIFDPAVLTKTTFGDRIRDKYMVVELKYDNAINNRFIIHNINTIYRISDR